MIFPNWTPLNIVFYSFWMIYAVSFGFLDYYSVMVVGYSKFASGKGVPSRIGMFIVYSLPLVVITLCALPYFQNATLIQWVVYAALMFHFGKRVIESLFLHKYSGTMDVLAVAIISVFYSFMAGMISWLNAEPAVEMGGWFYLGIVCFVVGQSANFYHHILLANLRKAVGGYHIPYGGWFEYAACPHYFFELLAWLGVALISRHLFAALVLLSMTGYLISRSIKTRQWYLGRFPDYPAKRKLMIPFVF